MPQIPKNLKAEKVDYDKDGAIVQCMFNKGLPLEPELTLQKGLMDIVRPIRSLFSIYIVFSPGQRNINGRDWISGKISLIPVIAQIVINVNLTRPVPTHSPYDQTYPTVLFSRVMEDDQGLLEWLENIVGHTSI